MCSSDVCVCIHTCILDGGHLLDCPHPGCEQPPPPRAAIPVPSLPAAFQAHCQHARLEGMAAVVLPATHLRPCRQVATRWCSTVCRQVATRWCSPPLFNELLFKIGLSLVKVGTLVPNRFKKSNGIFSDSKNPTAFSVSVLSTKDRHQHFFLFTTRRDLAAHALSSRLPRCRPSASRSVARRPLFAVHLLAATLAPSLLLWQAQPPGKLARPGLG